MAEQIDAYNALRPHPLSNFVTPSDTHHHLGPAQIPIGVRRDHGAHLRDFVPWRFRRLLLLRVDAVGMQAAEKPSQERTRAAAANTVCWLRDFNRHQDPRPSKGPAPGAACTDNVRHTIASEPSGASRRVGAPATLRR